MSSSYLKITTNCLKPSIKNKNKNGIDQEHIWKQIEKNEKEKFDIISQKIRFYVNTSFGVKIIIVY